MAVVERDAFGRLVAAGWSNIAAEEMGLRTACLGAQHAVCAAAGGRCMIAAEAIRDEASPAAATAYGNCRRVRVTVEEAKA